MKLQAKQSISVVAHPVLADSTFVARVIACPAVVRVAHHIDAPATAAYPPIFAPPAAHPAVVLVGVHVHAPLPAAVRGGASGGAAYPGILVACLVAVGGVRMVLAGRIMAHRLY